MISTVANVTIDLVRQMAVFYLDIIFIVIGTGPTTACIIFSHDVALGADPYHILKTIATAASPVGVNAEYVIDAVTGYHASSIKQWVERTAELIRNVERRKQFAGAAKKHVQKFDKNIIGKKLSSIISDFVKPASIDSQDTET